MPHFDADEVIAPSGLEPIGFRLGGADLACVPIVPIGRAQRLRDQMAGDTPVLVAIVDFIEDMVVPADRPALRARLLDTDDPVHSDAIIATFVWLCQVYAERANPDGADAGALATLVTAPATAPAEPDAQRVGAILRMGGQIA